MWPSSINRCSAPREAAGNFSHKNLSSRSEGRDFSTMKFSVRAVIRSIRRRLGRAFIPPVDQKNQGDTGADGGVGDVERGEVQRLAAAAPLQVKMEEVHDGVTTGQQAVGEVADDAAENQAERELAGERACMKMIP